MTAKKNGAKQKPATKVAPEEKRQKQSPLSWPRRKWNALRDRIRAFLLRRPHRSLRRTYRRDYVRSLQLPGYWAFTNHVRKTIMHHKALFICLTLFYGVLSIVLIGMASQDIYVTLGDTLRQTSGNLFTGGWGEVGKASLLLLSGATGTWTAPLSEAQQVYAILIMLLTWLSAVWLLRALLAGGKPRLRDALYSAGAPIVSTFVVCLVGVVQLLPVALAAAGFGAAVASGLISSGGVEAMLLWACIAALLGLSLYWLTSTFIALVVVTLPGMYPFRAIQTAGDLVVGRRVRILFRLLWMVLTILVAWFVVVVPVILFDTWLKGILPVIDWVPVVPLVMVAMSSLSIVWAAAYVYLLYRRVVDDDAAPA